MQANPQSITKPVSDALPAKGGIFGQLTDAFARMFPDLFPYKARRDLLRCGYYEPRAYDNYLALRNALVAGIVLTTACWFTVVADRSELLSWVLIGGAILTILAYSLPRLYLSWQGDRRADRIAVGLPDALDVIVMGMTGGLSLQQSLERSAHELREAHRELTKELTIVSRQATAASLEYALRRFADRVDIEEVTTLTQTVGHAEQMGSPLGAVLRDNADSLRKNRMQRAEERGNKLALKMLFPIVLCLAPAAFIVILAPPLLNLKNFRERENRAGGALSQPDIGKSSKSKQIAPNTKSSTNPGRKTADP